MSASAGLSSVEAYFNWFFRRLRLQRIRRLWAVGVGVVFLLASLIYLVVAYEVQYKEAVRSPVAILLPDEPKSCPIDQQVTTTCEATRKSELAYLQTSRELSRVRAETAREEAISSLENSLWLFFLLGMAVVSGLLAWWWSRPWGEDSLIAAIEIAEAGRQADAQPGVAMGNRTTTVTFSPGLIWSAMLDRRSEGIVSRAFERLKKDDPWLIQREPGDEGRQDAWRRLGSILISTPAFLYLVEEKSRGLRYCKTKLSSLMDRLGNKKEVNTGANAEGSVLPLWLLIGLVPITGYAAANAVEKTIDRQISDTNSRLEQLNTQIDERSDKEMMVVREGGSKDVEREKDSVVYYYPVQSTNGTAGGGNGGGTGSNPPTQGPVTQTCSPTQTVGEPATGTGGQSGGQKADKNDGPHSETTEGVTQVCSPKQVVKIESRPVERHDDDVQKPIEPIVLEFTKGMAVDECTGQTAKAPNGSSVVSAVIPIKEQISKKPAPAGQASGPQTNNDDALQGQTPQGQTDKNSAKIQRDCMQFTFTFGRHQSFDPVCIGATNTTNSKNTYAVYAGTTPIFNPAINAQVSLVNGPGYGGWPPSHWFGKSGVFRIKISPSSEAVDPTSVANARKSCS